MKTKKIKSKPVYKWSKRPSELKDFNTACYWNHDSGDYLRVDYKFPENRVRLYVEIKGHSDDSYSLEIVNGEISERSSSKSIRSSDVDQIFIQRIKLFYTIPSNKVIKEIKKVFNFEIQPEKIVSKATAVPEQKFSFNSLLMKYSLADFFDFILGMILIISSYIFFGRNLSLAGAVSALFGIISGAVDILIRRRKPLFSKILIFLISGLALYIYSLIY
jgi:hypothetical protein